VIHLRFVAFRESFAERGAEIHTGVAAVIDADLRLELAVQALLTHIKKMAGGTVADDRSFFRGPGFGMIVLLPTFEGLAVEHWLPIVFPGFLILRDQGSSSEHKYDGSHIQSKFSAKLHYKPP